MHSGQTMFFLLMLYVFIRYIKAYFAPRTKVVYKNSNFIIIDKDFDLKINSNDKNENTVQKFMKNKYPGLANKLLTHEFYFVHRLDFATSGLMCIPANKHSCRIISDAFARRTVKKYYVALVRGLFSEEVVDVDVSIGQDLRFLEIEKMCTANSKFCIRPRLSRTVFLVLEYGLYGNYPCTKILIRPVTGRRHQIRVHCNYLGHTIVGDYTYSNRKDSDPHRMFLNSTRLCFPYEAESYDFLIEDNFTKDWKSLGVINKFNNETFAKLDELI